MFIGHFAVGFAAKSFAPKVGLPVLLGAPLLLDLLWPVFLVTGLESVRIDPGNTAVTPLDLHHYPYSHSLLMAAAWSALAALVARLWYKDARSAGVLGLAVFSHWVLDALAHRPDLPLYPGSSTMVGLGLWHSVPATLAVEVSLYTVGIAMYARATRAARRTGTLALVSLVALLGVIYAGAVFGPPPPSVDAVVVSSFAAVGFLLWGYWIERTRVVHPALA